MHTWSTPYFGTYLKTTTQIVGVDLLARPTAYDAATMASAERPYLTVDFARYAPGDKSRLRNTLDAADIAHFDIDPAARTPLLAIASPEEPSTIAV